MKIFPGSFPPDVFDRLSLERYAEVYALAVAFLEAEISALEDARRKNG